MTNKVKFNKRKLKVLLCFLIIFLLILCIFRINNIQAKDDDVYEANETDIDDDNIYIDNKEELQFNKIIKDDDNESFVFSKIKNLNQIDFYSEKINSQLSKNSPEILKVKNEYNSEINNLEININLTDIEAKNCLDVNLSGKVYTENYKGIHKADVTIYNNNKVFKTIETNDDGSFNIKIDSMGEYDLIVSKRGYLNYKITNIVSSGDSNINLGELNLIAGDIVVSDVIQIDDLVYINDVYGSIITDENKDEIGFIDLNEDGVIDKLDRDILKSNYGKRTVIVNYQSLNIN